ncbi:MAG: hypothetical protein EOP84_15405 [Verrucomicrobiaceae bacterium]|nr:MAG: hypothetical protein EOP84_15405 [Verrucomicrobiaceae bacterium]
MKKLIASLFLGLTTVFAASAAPVDLGSSAAGTPYDAYMRPVRQVLGSIDGNGVSMDRVRDLMRKGRNFRYVFDEPYVASLPHVTEARKSGDCKDKALWLANQMGDENVRFVVGKARAVSDMSHAWLMWKNEGRWWILDCTNNSRPVAADSIARGEYVPLYSWSKRGVYRHGSADGLAASAVARKGRAPVGSR